MKSNLPLYTSAQKKAMNDEINRQIAENLKHLEKEINAVFLWQLHTQLGYGEKRLREFFNRFQLELQSLIKRYELNDTDTEFICVQMLKRDGIDFSDWGAVNTELEMK